MSVTKCHFSALTSDSVCFLVHHHNVELAETAFRTLAMAVVASSSAARSLGWSRDISEEQKKGKKTAVKKIFIADSVT